MPVTHGVTGSSPVHTAHSIHFGTLTEWLGSGLQNRVQQFESAGYLQHQTVNQEAMQTEALLLFYCKPISTPTLMYYISKRIEVAFAHQLHLNYESKCQNLHGHNGIITIYCCSEELDANGMVIDFTHVKQQITQKLDHRYLNDFLDFNPTAENIAHWIAQQIPHCYKVTFQESEGNIAAYVKPGFENAPF